jgi:hypothetical protein
MSEMVHSICCGLSRATLNKRLLGCKKGEGKRKTCGWKEAKLFAWKTDEKKQIMPYKMANREEKRASGKRGIEQNE